MSELKELKQHGQIVKTVDVQCHPSFGKVPFSIDNMQRPLVLALVAAAAVGIVLYLYSFIVPFLAIPLAVFAKENLGSEAFLKPVIHWMQEGIRPVANAVLAIPVLSLPVVFPLLILNAWVQGIATHICISNGGFSFSGQLGGILLSSPMIPWSALRSKEGLHQVEVRNEAIEFSILRKKLSWKALLSLCLICPAALKGFLSATILKLEIPLGSLPSELERERLFLALSVVLPEGHSGRLAGFTSTKYRPTYTDLWIEGLSPDTCPNLLTEGMTISEGRYVIEKIIGSGGEGVVYSAQRLNNDNAALEMVAIKEFVLPTQGGFLGVTRALEHIERESILLESLSHPGIINLLDCFVENNRVYLVLDLLEGKTLNEIVEETGALSEAHVIDLSIQMCEILHHLHSQKPPIVHRDFTPDNLMLLPDGTLKLIDFNVAQQLEASSTQTIVGKQSFIPPEQFRGKATVPSDLYALGATIYFLLTGEEPEPITVSKPRLANSNVSMAIDSIVSQLTQQDVALRFQQAERVRKELLACQVVSSSAHDCAAT